MISLAAGVAYNMLVAHRLMDMSSIHSAGTNLRRRGYGIQQNFA